MSDPYFKIPSSIGDPASHCYAVVPSDTVDLTTTAKAIYVGTTGDVKVELSADTVGVATVFKNVPAGAFLSIRARRIWSTGTTASNIVAMY